MRVDLFAVSDLLLPQPHPIVRRIGRGGLARRGEGIGDVTADVARSRTHVLGMSWFRFGSCAPLVIKFLIYGHVNAMGCRSQPGSSRLPLFLSFYSRRFVRQKLYILIERAAQKPTDNPSAPLANSPSPLP